MVDLREKKTGKNTAGRCPKCGRWMDKIIAWVCPKCGMLKKRESERHEKRKS